MRRSRQYVYEKTDKNGKMARNKQFMYGTTDIDYIITDAYVALTTTYNSTLAYPIQYVAECTQTFTDG